MPHPRDLRKRRTREHVLADMSFNHLESLALQLGWALERRTVDYGVDARMLVFDEEGRLEPGFVEFQLKATDRLERYSRSNGSEFAFSVGLGDLQVWAEEPHPVVFALYDGQAQRAFGRLIEPNDVQSITSAQATTTLRIPVQARVDAERLAAWGALKRERIPFLRRVQ